MKRQTLFMMVGLLLALAIGFKLGRGGGLRLNHVEHQAAPTNQERVLVLGDFESADEIEQWFKSGVLAEQTDTHATHGKYAVKLTYRGGVEGPCFKLEKWFQKHRQAQNWSNYKYLVFNLYNPQDDQRRLIFQLKDDDGTRHKEDILIGARQNLEWKVPLEDVGQQLNLKHIASLNLFQWAPKEASVVYLDYVRLEREEQHAAGAAPGASVAGETIPGMAMAPAGSHATATPGLGMADAAVTPDRLGGAWFQHNIGRWQVADDATHQPVVRIPVTLVGPQLFIPPGFPLSGGIPLAMGQLQPEAPVRLRDPQARQWPVQTRPLASWEDGSVKWLQVTTETPTGEPPRQLWVEYGAPVTMPATPSPSVHVEETADAVVVSSGPLRFAVNKHHFTFFDAVSADRNGDGQFTDDERLAGGGDLVLKFHDTEFRSSQDTQSYTLQIEERGPVRATLKASGWFRDSSGKGFCQFIVRLQAFAGSPQVRVYHTFIYTGYPANHFNQDYERIPLPENETIQAVSIELPVTTARGGTIITADDRSVLSTSLDAPVRIEQREQNAHQLLKTATAVRDGAHSEGWCLVQNGSCGVLAAVRDLWQQYPKAIGVDPSTGRLTIDLWPQSAGALNLETGPEAYGPDAVARGSAFGLGKTHELIFGFFGTAMQPQPARDEIAPWLEPWVLAAHPAWLQASDVMGTLGPVLLERYPEIETMLDDLFRWAERHPKNAGWYGMLHYGDTMTWYRKEAYDKSYDAWGWHPEGRWGWFNCEAMGTHAGALTSFLRTHHLKYFRFAEPLTRHIMDVDTVHYNTVANDPRLRGKMPDDAFSQVGSMHRHNAYHWGGRNEEASHTSVTGILTYYYLTGYDRAFDVAQEVGDFFVHDHVTYHGHPDMAPSRTLANVLWGDVLLYEATWDRKYKEAADRWAAVLVKGQQPDGTWLENYNPRSRIWNGQPSSEFMGLYILPSLIAYHRLTGNPSVADAIVKGADALLSRETYLLSYDGPAYSYLLTGKEGYLDGALAKVKGIAAQQRHGDDPMMDGMVFQKATYGRVPPALYSIPYLLGATDAKDFPTLEKILAHETAVPPYQVLVASSLEKVLPEVPATLAGAHPNPAQVALARNEYEAVQLLVTSDTALQQVAVEAGDLHQTGGAGVIPRDAITWSPVGFVKTKKPDYNVQHVGWWPDPLPAVASFEVKAGWPQPIWLTVYAPSGTPAGDYAGAVTIHPANAPPTSVQLRVHVWDFDLPTTPTLKTAFDVYPNRIQSAYSQFFPQWWMRWQAHPEELEARLYDDLLRHRVSPVLNAEVDPLQMRSLQRLADGGLSAFSVGKHGGSFDNDWPDGAAPLAALQPVYRSYAYQLRDAKLLDRHYVYTYDEPEPGSPKVADVARMIHEADPQLKNLVTLGVGPAVEKLAAWFKDIDIVCLRNVAFDPSAAGALQQMGKEVWLYVSGPSPPFPTFVIDYPAIAYRVIPWMCWKYHVQGLLYWCVNYWTTNPYTDPMNTKWGQNGNGSLYYPGPDGPVPSIRLAVLRDGIEDYEYLHLLDEQVQRLNTRGAGDPQTPSLLAQAEPLLTVDASLVDSMRLYSNDPQPFLARREAIARMIERLRRVGPGT